MNTYYFIHKGMGIAVARVSAKDEREAELHIPMIADALDYAPYDLMVEKEKKE